MYDDCARCKGRGGYWAFDRLAIERVWIVCRDCTMRAMEESGWWERHIDSDEMLSEGEKAQALERVYRKEMEEWAERARAWDEANGERSELTQLSSWLWWYVGGIVLLLAVASGLLVWLLEQTQRGE